MSREHDERMLEMLKLIRDKTPTKPRKVTPEEIAQANSCSLKGCDAPGDWMPQLTIFCKGPKGRGPEARGINTHPATPMCGAHRHLPSARDYLKHINWPTMIAKFNAVGLPGPRRSSAKLTWQNAP